MRTKAMRVLFFLITASLFLLLCNASDWPLFKKDVSNTGISPDLTPGNPIILWSADIQRMETTPIISTNLVYALAGNGSVWAFDKENGDLRWRSQLEGWVFQMSPLACSDDRIFAATDSGLLAAFDALTGQELWEQDLTDKRFETPLLYIDGLLYLGEGGAYGSGLKRFFCLYENGTECWNVSRNTKGYQWSGAAKAGEYLVFGQNDGVLLSVNRHSGEVADELNLNDSSRLSFSQDRAGRVRASVAFNDGYVYVTSEFSAKEGFAWKIGLDPNTGKFEDRGWSSPVGFSTSTPTVCNGRVYLGVGEHGHPGALVCLNDSSGDPIWTYPVEAGVKSSPSVSTAYEKPRILFTTAKVDGHIYCLEDAKETGELLWKLNPPDTGYILGGVAICDGRAYFGTEGDQHNGKLYCLGDEEGQDGWPQFHFNSQHVGYSASAAPKSNRTAWISEEIGAQPGSSVSVAEGKVFVNCISNITCLDQKSGKVLWIFPFNASGDFAFGFTPVYSRGRVFFTSNKTYCLNATDGSEIWSFSQPTRKFAIDGSPAIADGRAVVSDWDGHHYYCLDEKTGTQLWNFTVEGNAQSTPAIDRDRMVFGSWDWGLGGKIHCVDLGNGLEIWNISTDNSPCGSATIHEGVIFMATYNFDGDGDLLALNLDNGSLLWKAQVSPTDSTPAVADGRVYLCSGCEGFSKLVTYCFDANSGELIWSTSAKERIGDWRCSPAYADGLLFVGRSDLTEYAGTYALNATTGKVVWSYPDGGSSPAVANGMVFTIGSGRVYAFQD
ncbi:MAG: PQQ-binding-like beta-propeller repeat protein [Methanothrix sp.]|nr:PQQ-binding-like beta-propeller repeat protein [Methanothrix sp.]